MGKEISNIVFTKNRPLQLDGYLESLYRHFPAGLIQTYILYKPELFEEEYQQLFRKYPNCVLIREDDFHNDFLKLLSEISTQYILFGVDDVVYFDSVDFGVIDDTFNKFSKDIFGFSLRYGPENTNYMDGIMKYSILQQTVYKMNWPLIREYPFELCATIYPTALIKRIINNVSNNNSLIKTLFSPGSVIIRALGKITSTRSILKSFGYFFSPNTLESWNCRWCQNHSDQLPTFLYFQRLCASAIQVNMVNTSTRNESEGSVKNTVETLAKRYQEGYGLDLDFISSTKPTAASCGCEFFKLVKKI